MDEEVIDMDVIENLCETYGISRNQRVSTLMDAIDAADGGDDDDDDGDDDDDDGWP